MDEYLKEFTQKIISDSETEVDLENKKDINVECIKGEISRQRQTGDRDAKVNSVNGSITENLTQQNSKSVELNTPVTLITSHAKRKKRRAPPPPVTIQATSTKATGKEIPTSKNADVTKKTATSISKQNDSQINILDQEKLVKCEPQSSVSEMSVGSNNLEESGSELSLSNPFHPQYEIHIGQLQKHGSLSSINVSETCSEFSLSNMVHTRYDELTGTGSVTESESELSLSNPFNPHYEDDMNATKAVKVEDLITDKLIGERQDERDEFIDQAVKGKKGLVKRVKRLFVSLIPCLRKNAE